MTGPDCGRPRVGSDRHREIAEIIAGFSHDPVRAAGRAALPFGAPVPIGRDIGQDFRPRFRNGAPTLVGALQEIHEGLRVDRQGRAHAIIGRLFRRNAAFRERAQQRLRAARQVLGIANAADLHELLGVVQTLIGMKERSHRASLLLVHPARSAAQRHALRTKSSSETDAR